MREEKMRMCMFEGEGGYMLFDDWNSANALPLGSVSIAKWPTFGISCFGRATVAPRLVACFKDSSMDLTPM